MIEVNVNRIEIEDDNASSHQLRIEIYPQRMLFISSPDSKEPYNGTLDKDEVKSLIQSLQYFVDNGIFRDV